MGKAYLMSMPSPLANSRDGQIAEGVPEADAVNLVPTALVAPVRGLLHFAVGQQESDEALFQ
jgi:hypothetical protein